MSFCLEDFNHNHHQAIPVQHSSSIIFRMIALKHLEQLICLDASVLDESYKWYKEHLRREIGTEQISLKSRRADSYQTCTFKWGKDFPPITLFTVSHTPLIQADDQEFISLDQETQLFMIGGFEVLRDIRKIPTHQRYIQIPILIYHHILLPRAKELSRLYRRPLNTPKLSLSVMRGEEAKDSISKHTYTLIENNKDIEPKVVYKRQLKQSSELLFTFNSVRRMVTCALLGTAGFQRTPESVDLSEVNDQIDVHKMIFDGCQRLLKLLIEYIDTKSDTESSHPPRPPNMTLLLPTQLMLGVLGASLHSKSDDQDLESRLSKLHRLIEEIDWCADLNQWEGIAGTKRTKGGRTKKRFSMYGIRKAGLSCYKALHEPYSALGMRIRDTDRRISEKCKYDLELVDVNRKSFVNAICKRNNTDAEGVKRNVIIISENKYLNHHDSLKNKNNDPPCDDLDYLVVTFDENSLEIVDYKFL